MPGGHGVYGPQANYLDTWKCVATLRGDGQAAGGDMAASLGKQVVIL